MSVMLLWLCAQAAEVVWLSPPTPARSAEVLAMAGASEPISLARLRAGGAAAQDADAAALDALSATLADVRTFETRLDGEKVIMSELEAALGRVELLSSEADRGKIFAALAYQGFAVNRYYDVDLASDDSAAPWRVVLDSGVIERPWRDAVALDPERTLSAYEVAEAPQRVAYGAVRDEVRATLPGSLAFDGLPRGATLWVDGSPRALESSGTLRLLAGRHWVHAVLDGEVVARWVVSVQAAESQRLSLPLTDALWQGWLDGLAAGAALPPEVADNVRALGGELWLVSQDQVLVVTPSGVVEGAVPSTSQSPTPARTTPLELRLRLEAGWLSSGNFYTQDPTTPRTAATVNAGTVGLGLGGSLPLGPLRVGAGVDLPLALGPNHAAIYGDGRTRLRAFPHLSVGTRSLSAALGYLFPHHPAAAVRLWLPLQGSLALTGQALGGLGGQRDRADGSTWTNLPVYAASGGVGVRY